MSVTQEHIRRPVHAGCQMNHDQHTLSEGGSPRRSSVRTGRPVHAGGPNGFAREICPRGRPDINNTMTYLEAGPHRRPNERQPGSPSEREAP